MAFWRWFMILPVLIVLAACGGAEPEPTATPRPTSTNTPVSTPLPDVGTAVPAGIDAGNPVRIVIPANLGEAAADALAAQVSDLAEVAVQVSFVETQALALAALCDATPTDATVAWLADFAVGVAALRDCGVPRIQITREAGRESLTGEPGVLLATFEVEFEEASEDSDPNAAQFADRTFCRTRLNDLYSWTVPALLLEANGVSMEDFADINEVEDADALIAALQDGTCDVTGLPQRTWEQATDADDALEDVINVLATSPDFPYGVLYFSYDVSLDVIDALTETFFVLEADGLTLEATSESEAAAEATETVGEITLSDVFGTGQFIDAEAVDFSDLADLLRETGLNFTAVRD